MILPGGKLETPLPTPVTLMLLRARVNEIDQQLMGLIERRAHYVGSIANEKQQAGMTLLDVDQETIVRERWRRRLGSVGIDIANIIIRISKIKK